MDAASLIPLPDALPVAYHWFNILLIAAFATHILLINATVGLVAIAVFTPQAKDYPTRDATTSLMALAVNIGVAVLLSVQALYGQFMYVSSILLAWYWMSAMLAAMLAYAGLYGLKYKWGERLGWSAPLGLAALGFFVFTAFVLSNNVTLMLRPDLWSGYFSQGNGTLLATSDPSFWPRYAHFLLACPAVGGLALALLKRKGQGPESKRGVALGLKLYAHSTLAQFAVGFWYLLSLPREAMLMFMGRSGLASGLLLSAIACGVLSLVTAFKGRVRPTAWLLVATVCAMAWLRDLVRQSLLAPYFSVQSLAVKPEPSTFALFLAALAGLALLVRYLLKRYKAGEI